MPERTKAENGHNQMRVACVLVTHLRARVEMQRRPSLAELPVTIADRSQRRPMVLDRFPAAQRAAAGMTLEQALSRQKDWTLLESDEPVYRRAFRHMLASLQGVSDRVEPAELGTAYVRLDGLEELYGNEARLVTNLLNAVPRHLEPRAGIGDGKFPAYIAARSSRPMGATMVPPDAAGFLTPQPVDLLPIRAKIRDELHRLGVHTLGDVAAVSQDALIDRFGPEGQKAWELAQGIDRSPLVPMQ